MKLHLFVGPTAAGLAPGVLEQRDVILHAPARRGDVQALVEQYPQPGCIAIVDGTFHSFPSVGHIEIRRAIEQGWNIWGLASMGAIRASEMRLLGMQGYGVVYGHYRDDPEFDDDEVTLVHEIDAPYRAMSEPLIHVRGFVAALVEQQTLSADNAHAIIRDLKERWYAERTLSRLRKLLLACAEMTQPQVDDALAGFKAFRVKSQDLQGFLSSRCWHSGSEG
ncbi:hypothetical protein IFT37_16395 [Pseudomonas fluorescens]|uniref:TfuA-like protein n=1 Tax=Pseudomonas fluorescens group TaxID=136843 RepID=UPI00177B11DD|nr:MULTISPECIES: TfuA-like protein [Pseudomonas fluorescens group]MBD8147517.1 hypothetical protein [Pseudomonas fluorescens]MBD8177034.1 hypothetical protein [Pseudomonas fluorescens]MBD8746692.1 hypothetical protein [Pseudomonas fluorescens]MBD8751118.1 hypothetical protein [Pseudomonas fluorescens]MBD8760039.1 hypothetical protein [Pseudomonas fluorescens]